MKTPSPSLQAAMASALLEPDRACPAGLRAWNGSDVSRRLAVHRNTVLSSLVDALADTFPVTQELVGTEFFRAMAAVFVRESPPRSPLLFLHGAGFPVFIERFEPAAHLAYLADVARLEFARLEAFHAADAAPLQREALQTALRSTDDVGGIRLRPQPSLRLVESRFPVVSIWAAHQGDWTLEEIDPDRAEAALVLRPRLDVLVVPCDTATLRFARAMQAGMGFADCAAAAGPGGELSATLSLLLANDALAGIVTSTGVTP
jgi:hypothetical protein